MITGETKINPENARARRLRLVEWVHVYRDEAKRKDMAGFTPGHTKMPTPQGRYRVSSPANDFVPLQHDRIVLTPLPSRRPKNEIAFLYLYIPTAHQDVFDDGPAQSYVRLHIEQPNDVLLCAVGQSGEALGNYLLNAGGFTPYGTIAQNGLDFDPHADVIHNVFQEGDPRDVFIAVETANVSRLPHNLDVNVFEEILTEGDYTYALQINE